MSTKSLFRREMERKHFVTWPPPPLFPAAWENKPQTEWDPDDWRAYAWHLETMGEKMLARLRLAEHEVHALRKRLTRRHRGPAAPSIEAWHELWKAGLVKELETPKIDRVVLRALGKLPRPGRKLDSAAWQRAQQAYAIRSEMESGGKKATNLDALLLWYQRNGKAQARALKDQQALSRMEKLHTIALKSKRR